MAGFVVILKSKNCVRYIQVVSCESGKLNVYRVVRLKPVEGESNVPNVVYWSILFWSYMPAFELNKSELARFLVQFRKFTGRTRSDVGRLLPGVKDNVAGWVPRKEKTTSLDRFEGLASRTGVGRMEPVALSDAYHLASAYDVPFLMLDSLLGTCSSDQQVSHTLDSFVSPQEELGEDELGKLGSSAQYGSGAVYGVPMSRLANCEMSIAHVSLQGSVRTPAATDCHVHPGNELLYIRKGAATLRFPASGMEVALREGDFAHYYSDQPHGMAASKDVDVVVIRFYQMERLGTRLKAIDAVNDLLPRLTEKGFQLGKDDRKLVKNVIGPWFRLYTAQPVWRGLQNHERSHTGMILDAVGLRLMLQESVPAGRSNWDIKELAKRSAELESPWVGGASLRKIVNGRGISSISMDQVTSMSKVFGIPCPLFYPFFFQTVPRCVIVHRDSEDLHELGLTEPEVGDDGSYLMPKRRLAGADSEVVFLKLQAKRSSVPNSHPGFEFVMPLDGNLSVSLDGEAGDIVVKQGSYIQFCSSVEHTIHNTDDSTTTAMIVRSYEAKRRDAAAAVVSSG